MDSTKEVALAQLIQNAISARKEKQDDLECQAKEKRWASINLFVKRIQKDLGEDLYSLLAENLTPDFCIIPVAKLEFRGKSEIKIFADEEWYYIETYAGTAKVKPEDLREELLVCLGGNKSLDD